MTPQELKNSILQFAFKGKLVSPTNQLADELYFQIQQNKKELLKKQKIHFKKTNPISDEDYPYEIPENWKWVRLCDVFYLIPTGVEEYSGKKTYYSTGSISSNINEPEGEYSFEERPSRANREHLSGDLLDAKMQKTIKTLIIDDKLSHSIFSTGFYGLRSLGCDIRFLKYYIESNFYQSTKNSLCSGVTQKAINDDKLINIPFPLPPLAEQISIVERIEAIFSLVDEYKKVWSKLSILNELFPEKMKQSLLNFAMKGKLVEQRAEEGSGNELLNQIKKNVFLEKPYKKEDTFDEPFEIPESWSWSHMGNIYNIHSSKRIHANEYTNNGIPFFRSLEVVSLAKGIEPNISYYISEKQFNELKSNYIIPKNGDLLITCIGGSIGWNWIVDDRVFYYKDGNVVAFDGHNFFNVRFLKYYLSSPLFSNQVKKDVSGTAYNALTIEMLKRYLIPVPPLKEQERIVTKLDELLPLCRKLVK